MKKFKNIFIGFLIFFGCIFSTIKTGSASWVSDEIRKINEVSSNKVSAQESNPVAYYDSTYFSSLEAAINSANNVGNKTVYVIPGSNPIVKNSFTINSGVSLILPYENETYINSPTSSNVFKEQDDATYMKLKVTLDDGVKITNYGTMIVGGSIGAGAGAGLYGGATNGNYAQLTLKDNSQVLCKNGSKLTVYGYITEYAKHQGDYDEVADRTTWPKIILESGSILNAPFIIHDFRGGSVTYGLNSDKSSKNVIFFNEYEICNVRPLVNIQYGASLTVDTWLYASSDSHSAKDIKIIGNSSSHLFQMSSGAIIDFKYNYANNNSSNYSNRYLNFMDIRVRGNCKINALTLNVAGTSLDTSSFRFSLSYSFHLYFFNGTITCSNKLKLMKGCRVFIDETATLNVDDLISYENYKDLSTDSHTAYPNTASEPILINNGVLSAQKLAGLVISTNEGAQTTATNTSITSYEHLNHSGSTIFTSVTYTTINGSLKLKLLKNGLISDVFENVGPGTYFSYVDTESNYGRFSNAGTISYDCNGSSTTFSPKTITIGNGGYTINNDDIANTPVREHYNFDGWFLDENCTISALSNVVYSSVVLYAKWSPINYSISYNFNVDFEGNQISGQSNDSRNPTQFNVESNLNLYPAKHNSLIFDGWYIDSLYQTKITQINSNIFAYLSSPYNLNLYGRWYPADTETFTITYVNDNTDEGCTCISSEDILSVNVDKLVVPDLSGKNSNTSYGKYFDGWYLDSSFNNKYTSNSQITGSCELYANWLNKNEITIGIAGNNLVQTIRYLNKDAIFTVPDAANYGITLPTGYEMVWQVTGGALDGHTLKTGQTGVCLSTSRGQSITVVGEQTPISYNLTINVGSNETATYSIKRGNTIIVNDTTIAASSTENVSQSINVNDVITIKVSAESDYTAGNIAVTNLTGNASPYTVSGTGNATITVANASKNSGGCFSEDTLINTLNGLKKAKDLIKEDKVLTFNHFEGKFEYSNILALIDHGNDYNTKINVIFDDGSNFEIINAHGVLMNDTKKYESINRNSYNSFINREVVCENNGSIRIKKIVDIEVSEEYCHAYSILTDYNVNCVTDNVLSITETCVDITCNYFEMDNSYKYDEKLMEEDINKYGLYSYEEWKDYMSLDFFEKINGKYCNIVVQKGITTKEHIINVMKYVANLFKTGQAR